MYNFVQVWKFHTAFYAQFYLYKKLDNIYSEKFAEMQSVLFEYNYVYSVDWQIISWNI